MPFFPVFLSVVLVVRNHAAGLEKLLSDAARGISPLVTDYELIIVDNASDDDSVSVLKHLTREDGHPNLQIYALTKVVDNDTAFWVGLENALGDFVAVVDPMTDDVGFLPQMLEKAVRGADVVFATNARKAPQSLAYRAANGVFNAMYQRLNGIHLAREAPQYRILSKRVIHFILQYPQPAAAYRHLPATGGFARANLDYDAEPRAMPTKNLWDSIDRGTRLLISTNRTPIRLVTALSLFGAIANVVYSFYVLAVALLKSDVAPGWVSLSLQQSGMFLLISLVLLVLGEYIAAMVNLSNAGPPYHVAQEFTSARLTRQERLNVEDARAPASASVPAPQASPVPEA